MTVLRNEGRWDVSNARAAGELIAAYDRASPSPDMSWIDYGLSVLTHRALAVVAEHEPDLATVFTELARRGELAAYEANKRFHEIGSPRA